MARGQMVTAVLFNLKRDCHEIVFGPASNSANFVLGRRVLLQQAESTAPLGDLSLTRAKGPQCVAPSGCHQFPKVLVPWHAAGRRSGHSSSLHPGGQSCGPLTTGNDAHTTETQHDTTALDCSRRVRAQPREAADVLAKRPKHSSPMSKRTVRRQRWASR